MVDISIDCLVDARDYGISTISTFFGPVESLESLLYLNFYVFFFSMVFPYWKMIDANLMYHIMNSCSRFFWFLYFQRFFFLYVHGFFDFHLFLLPFTRRAPSAAACRSLVEWAYQVGQFPGPKNRAEVAWNLWRIFDGLSMIKYIYGVPSGKLRVCYWKWP